MAVPTFGSASTDVEFSGSTTFTVTAPASVATGDGLIALVWNHDGFFGSVGDLTPPSPWVTIAEVLIGNAPIAGLYTLIAPSASPSFAWTMNDGGNRAGAICRVEAGTFDVDAPIWTGLDVTAGVDYSLTFDASAGTAVAATTITPPYDECLGVSLYCASTPFGGFVSTDWTQRSLIDNDSHSAALATTSLTTSATGTVNATADVSVASNAGIGALVAVPAAGTVVLPPVSRVAVGAKSAGGTTTVSIAYPTGLAAGDQIFAFRAMWESSVTPSNESGWTALGGLAGGTGTAVDNHTTEIRGDSKDTVAGTETGSVTFDQTGTGADSGVIGVMVAYQLDDPTDTWDIAASTGDDATHGANRSITASTNTALAVDDVVVVAVAVDTDTSLTITSPAITASGITFGATTRLTSGAGVTTGDDGNIELFEAKVTSGSGTAALGLAFTTATSQCGPALFVRLRAVPSGGPVELTLSGSVTATGRVIRSTSKTVAGSTTATGRAVKLVGKRAQGSVTASGALIAALTRVLALTGSVAASGALFRSVTKTVAGASTPAGVVRRSTSLGLAGSVTPTGGPVLLVGRALAGSVTATGRLVRGVLLRPAGSVAAAGRVGRLTLKLVAGTLTPTGVLTFGNNFTQTLTGSVAATGRLVRATLKAVSGSSAPTGRVGRLTTKRVAGSVTPSGSLLAGRLYFLVLSGTVAATGRLVKTAALRVSGSVTPAGRVVRFVAKRVAGAVAAVGSLVTSGGAPDVVGQGTLTAAGPAATLTAVSAGVATLTAQELA